jgi:hypothetical protein
MSGDETLTIVLDGPDMLADYHRAMETLPPVRSRSVLRREAAMRGEDPPDFSRPARRRGRGVTR